MPIEVKAYSKKEIAKMYSITIKVLRIWLHPHKNKIGEYVGKSYTPKQVAIIFESLGEPNNQI